MIIITDTLKLPLDEGPKNIAHNIIYSYKNKHSCSVYSINSGHIISYIDKYFTLNKLYFNFRFYNAVKSESFKRILYIPYSSITTASLLRSKLLSIFTKKKVNILSIQPVFYNFLQKSVISLLLRPHNIITQSVNWTYKLKNIGINSTSLPMGVDTIVFRECNREKKMQLRKKYSIDPQKKLLLHVGHLKYNRNINWIVKIKRALHDMNFLFVANQTVTPDVGATAFLKNNGIIVMKQYVPTISEIYHLADFYVFTVQRDDGATETPLSVLEAMATNLPIVTTRYGSLPDTFSEDQCFKYADNPDQMISILKSGFPEGQIDNREKILPYSWEFIAEKIFSIINCKS